MLLDDNDVRRCDSCLPMSLITAIVQASQRANLTLKKYLQIYIYFRSNSDTESIWRIMPADLQAFFYFGPCFFLKPAHSPFFSTLRPQPSSTPALPTTNTTTARPIADACGSCPA
jgi:hypothetical protein